MRDIIETIGGWLAAVIIATALLVFVHDVDAAPGTYYIDYSTGSNTNNGTSKATPWKTHPYMPASSACTGTGSLPAYSHNAGDKFIFKGGVTWPAACLPLTITTSGTSSAIDYYGVDKTWFTGGSWTRPLFDAAYANKSYMVYANGITNVTIDNLELAHQGITFSSTYTTNGCGIFFSNVNYSGNAGTTVENVYLHDWVGLNDMNGKLGTICEGGIEAVQKVLYSEIGDPGGYGYNGTTQVFEAFGGGVAYGGEVAYSKIHDGWDGCTTILGAGCHDNEFYGIEQNTLASLVNQPGGLHTQVIEDNESCSTLAGSHMAVYNNYIHDNDAGVNIFVRYFSDIYNNVMFNNQNNQQIRLCIPPNGDKSSDVGHVFNNTFDLNVGTYSTAIGPTTYGTHTTADGTIYIQNNITISATGSGTVGGITATTSHISNNYSMGNTEASTYGFTSTTKYNPTSNDTNVTGQGLNLSSFCAGSLGALCFDAEGAPWYGGSYMSRPPAGGSAWTLGPYNAFGTSSPAASFNPTTLSFGNVYVSTSTTLSTTLTNSGTGDLSIMSVSTTAPFSQKHSCTALTAGKSCGITVTFAPTSAVTSNANLTVTFGGGVSTQNVPLSGTGVSLPVTLIPQITNPYFSRKGKEVGAHGHLEPGLRPHSL